MGKVEEALRDLIRFHSRRAAAEALRDLPAQLRRARRDIRGLQRAIEGLSAQVGTLLETKRQEMAVPPAPHEEATKVRFSKRALRSIRKRFALTQQEVARLLEVSPVTITAWETGRSRPRSANLARIVTLRSMSQAQVDGALGREQVRRAPKPDNLKKLRKRLSLTQAGLAALVGVSTAAVTSWETGKTTPARKARDAIAELRRTRRGPADRRAAQRPGPGATGQRPTPLTPSDIKAIRKRAGLSQKEMADRLGVSPNAVSNWETGRSVPRGSNVQKVMGLRK